MSHTNDSMKPDGGPVASRHERLCEYVFGEMQGEERERFELELAGDEALRHEHAELVGTAELVREALPIEKLSDEMRATLSAAASRRSARGRFEFLRGGGSLLRVAAGILLLLGAGFGARSWMLRGNVFEESAAPAGVARKERRPTQRPQEEALVMRGKKTDAVARLEESVRSTRPSGGQGEGDEADRSSQVGGQEEMPLTGRMQAPGQDAPDLSPEETLVLEGVLGEQRLAYESTLSKESLPGDEEVEEQFNASRARAPEAAVSPGSASPGPVAPGRFSARSVTKWKAGADRQERAQSGSDTFFLGRGPSRESGRLIQMNRRRSQTSDRDAAESAAPSSQQGSRVRLRDLGYDGGAADDNQSRNEPTSIPSSKLSLEEVRALGTDIINSCWLQPGETWSDMFFRSWGEHPFEWTADEPLSTFSVDVDTASYTLARRYLHSGSLPPGRAVRTEEFLNYFSADKDAPQGGDVFGIHIESAPSLFHANPRVDMLRVTVRAKDVAAFERKPLALTLVIDLSGSMRGERLELVKDSVNLLLSQLHATDAIALIGFSEEAQVILPMTSAARRGVVEDALFGLAARGGTNIGSGLTAGYAAAVESLTPNAINRVVLLSDGVGNIGVTDQERLLAEVAEYRSQGVYLNTIGVGMGNHNDHFLEQLADRGDGVCQYFDSEAEARRALVDQFTQTLQPVARDVKIQVKFDPSRVESYRQIGYENRALAAIDFRNDAVDAGEINAGHQVTALYEIVLAEGAGGGGDEQLLGIVHVRYKEPFSVDTGKTDANSRARAEQAVEMVVVMRNSDRGFAFMEMGWGYRRAVVVAQFAELLRRSVHARSDSVEALRAEARGLVREREDPELTELLELIQIALPLLEEEASSRDLQLSVLTDELRTLNYERGRRERLLRGDPLDPERERLYEERVAELKRLIQRHLAERYGHAESYQALEQLEALGYSDR